MFTLYRIALRDATKVWTAKTQNWNKSFTRNEHRTSAAGRARLVTKFQSSPLNTYFHRSGSQFSLLIIYFRNGPKSFSDYTKVWHKTYTICDAPLSRSALLSSAQWQKSRRLNRSYLRSWVVVVPWVLPKWIGEKAKKKSYPSLHCN